MTTWVKICGLTAETAVAAALDAGADAVGAVLVEASPRYVDVRRAAELLRPARGRAQIVAVIADFAPDALDAALADLRPDAVQLHGREAPEDVAALRNRLEGRVKIWKALAVSEKADLARAGDFQAADRLLLDAKPPKGASRTGGFGAAIDWRLVEGWRAPKPWILSAGLTPETVGDAIRATGATAVDVSSGVESSPGVKDIAKIAAFIAAAKAARPAGAAA